MCTFNHQVNIYEHKIQFNIFHGQGTLNVQKTLVLQMWGAVLTCVVLKCSFIYLVSLLLHIDLL